MGVTNITQYVKDLEESIKRIDAMEKTISQLVDRIAEIANYYYKEKQAPYKCPVCDGRGWKVVGFMGDKMRDHCHSCNESGILWK